mmetsp:Transcript_16062/g.33222  ORF Transcript_16062/g.33222 Transcript_16062/m.33222 type:complete len:241 (-) Transcript_16062:302-1024(-)
MSGIVDQSTGDVLGGQGGEPSSMQQQNAFNPMISSQMQNLVSAAGLSPFAQTTASNLRRQSNSADMSLPQGYPIQQQQQQQQQQVGTLTGIPSTAGDQHFPLQQQQLQQLQQQQQQQSLQQQLGQLQQMGVMFGQQPPHEGSSHLSSATTSLFNPQQPVVPSLTGGGAGTPMGGIGAGGAAQPDSASYSVLNSLAGGQNRMVTTSAGSHGTMATLEQQDGRQPSPDQRSSSPDWTTGPPS